MAGLASFRTSNVLKLSSSSSIFGLTVGEMSSSSSLLGVTMDSVVSAVSSGEELDVVEDDEQVTVLCRRSNKDGSEGDIGSMLR